MTTKGIPSVPDVPSQITDDDLYRILEPLKRVIDIRQGKFDPFDRWVTMQDLVDFGVVTESSVESPIPIIDTTVFCFDGGNSTSLYQGATIGDCAERRMQMRRDTAANWTSVNPVLMSGELALETDTGYWKVGNGSTAWGSLGGKFFLTEIGTTLTSLVGGRDAAPNLTAGRSLVVGTGAAAPATTAANNAIYGSNAAELLENGDDNVIAGTYACPILTSGRRNVCIGKDVANGADDPDDNVLIGFEAGFYLFNRSDGNVMIGHQVGPEATIEIDNQLWIHNACVNNPLIWGDFAAREIVINGVLTVTGDFIDTTGNLSLSSDGEDFYFWDEVNGEHNFYVQSGASKNRILRLDAGEAAKFFSATGQTAFDIQGNSAVVSVGLSATWDDPEMRVYSSAIGSPKYALYQFGTEKAFLRWNHAETRAELHSDNDIAFYPYNTLLYRFGSAKFYAGNYVFEVDQAVGAGQDNYVMTYDDVTGEIHLEEGDGHIHDTSAITSGTFADARIAESNVTNHEAALTITESQISDLQSYGIEWTVVTETTTSRSAAVYEFVLVDDDTAGGAVAINLPSGHFSGDLIGVKKLGTTANVTIDANASENIDNSLTLVLSTQYASAILISDGTDWWVV